MVIYKNLETCLIKILLPGGIVNKRRQPSQIMFLSIFINVVKWTTLSNWESNTVEFVEIFKMMTETELKHLSSCFIKKKR